MIRQLRASAATLETALPRQFHRWERHHMDCFLRLAEPKLSPAEKKARAVYEAEEEYSKTPGGNAYRRLLATAEGIDDLTEDLEWVDGTVIAEEMEEMSTFDVWFYGFSTGFGIGCMFASPTLITTRGNKWAKIGRMCTYDSSTCLILTSPFVATHKGAAYS